MNRRIMVCGKSIYAVGMENSQADKIEKKLHCIKCSDYLSCIYSSSLLIKL